MDFTVGPWVNLVLSVLVVAAAYVAYRKDNGAAWLYTALAFSLFSLSHVVSVAGASAELEVPMIAIRALGYLLMVYGIHKGVAAAKPPPAPALAKPQRRKAVR